MTGKTKPTLCLSDLCNPIGVDKESYIQALYQVLLRRDPDQSGFERLLARDDIQNFLPEILASQEFRKLARTPAYVAAAPLAVSNRTRVLLFGAYGNGNLGDSIQASSLARAITFIRPDIDVWACSAMPAPYPFQYHRTLPSDAILKPALVNSFDLLLIGGGGLLSHPHDPLTDPKWQAMLQVPVAFIGIGAEESVAERSEILVKKAAYVSARDEQSIAALRRFAREVNFIPDPVLSDVMYLQNQIPSQLRPDSRRLWVLKYINTPSFRILCDHILRNKDAVCFVEPHLDFGIFAHIPTAKPIYCIDDIIPLIDWADIVFSMRYHGCILAMLRGKPAFGFTEMKSMSLLRRYENESLFFKELVYPLNDPIKYHPPEIKLADDRMIFLRGLSKALAVAHTDDARERR